MIPSKFIKEQRYEIVYGDSYFTGTLKDIETKENEVLVHFMTENILLVQNSGIWYVIKGSRRIQLVKFEIVNYEVSCEICGKKYESDDALSRHQSRSKICKGISKLPTINLQEQLNKAKIKIQD